MPQTTPTPISLISHTWQSNSYLINHTLIDAGINPTHIQPYKSQIKQIILTHGHFDHIFHATEISKLCNNAEIFIGEHDLPFLNNPDLSLSNHINATITPIQATPLKDGDTIDGFTVYHTPGHTQGSICLFRESDGVLIAGDTIFPEGSYGRYDFPTGSLEDLRKSVSRIAELPVESLYSGHGEPVTENAKPHILLSKQNLNSPFA